MFLFYAIFCIWHEHYQISFKVYLEIEAFFLELFLIAYNWNNAYILVASFRRVFGGNILVYHNFTDFINITQTNQRLQADITITLSQTHLNTSKLLFILRTLIFLLVLGKIYVFDQKSGYLNMKMTMIVSR